MQQKCIYRHRLLVFIFPLLSFVACLTISLCTSISFAASKIQRVPHSVKPLDLSRAPTTKELTAAGQLGGQLYPTEDIEIEDRSIQQDRMSLKVRAVKETERFKRNRAINLSFGQAIQEWNKHEYKKAVKVFKKHIEDFPDSPWASEARLHMGCDARYNGRYTEAETQYKWIIENNKGKSHEGAKRLMNKARLRLGVLKVLQNNPDKATEIFAELKKESLSWRERTYASHWIQRISRYKAQGLAMLKCGTEALAYLMEKEGKEVKAREVAEIIPETENGHSISDLIDIASSYSHELVGLKLAISELNQIPLPAIMQITGKNNGDKGHYWVLDKVSDNTLELYDPQSKQRFVQNFDEFSNEWTGKTLVSALKTTERIPGIKLSDNEIVKSYGGCCGVPRPESDLGDGDDGDDDCSKGSPIWKVNKINMNLYVKDIPLWYNPPIGPSVKIKLSYNSQSAIAYNEPFGNKWMFNFGSYLVEDTGENVTIFMPDGRRDVYTPDGQGGYTKPFGVFNTLTKISDNHFELEFLDGTDYVYNIPAGTSSLQPFLVEIRDAYGQKLTFGYNSNVQLVTITDALNRVTTLTYNTDGLVERIDDPFGRSASFEYDVNRNLTKITDMGGYWTEFSYDADVYLTKIENEKGKWDFYIEPADGIIANSDNYPPPGDSMWQNYRITVTNPLGGKEEYFYYGGSGAYSWYVRPRDYITWQSQEINNFRSNVPKTYYYLTRSYQKGKIRKIQYPEGGYVNFSYDSSTGKQTSITDYHSHSKQYTYNSNGRITSFTDAENNTTTYTYYPNNIDIQTIDNGLGPISYTYNSAHDITSFTDKLGNTTTYAYNSYGQVTSITEAQGTPVERTTELVYDPTTHELLEIKRDGNTLISFTYDNIGRVKTFTDATGLTLTYDYDNLNRVTKVTYPDTRFVTFTYSSCCPRLIDSITDRAGLTTNYTYDALKRLIKMQGPDGIIKYEYDVNGNRTKLIDADSKTTSFEYNLDNRLVKKIYADGKFIEYAYDLSGLLTKFTTSRNIEKNYTYDENHNLLSIDYSDTTPDVTLTYDDYNRLISRTDGIGLYQYGYDTNSRLTGIDSPWSNDTITFQYNELGQLTNLIPQGGHTISYNYDTIGRLTDIQSGANTFTYNYTGVNTLAQNLTRPNGSYTEYFYNDPLKRLTEITNKDSSQTIINKHVFTYNNLDVIGTETITTGTPIDSFTEGLKTYNYNNINQLLNATNPMETFTYDDDGNMTQGYTPEGYVFTATYDAENRLTSLTYNDGSIDHETKYFYSGDSMLAKIEKYEDSILMSETRFIRAGFLPVQERNASNNVVKEYTWGLNMGGGIGGLINLNQGGQDYSYLYDGKGNVMVVIDSNQNPVASYRYDVFGVPLKKTGTLDQPYRFSTKQYDDNTGLYAYEYRFYDPLIGKWLTRDPLGEASGINLYGFVGNNPINFVDPLGLLTWKERAFVTGLGIWRFLGPVKVYIEGLGWVKPIPGIGTVTYVLTPTELSDPYLGPDGRWYWPDGTPVNPNDPSPDDQVPCK